jgi:hypothetical protein
VLIASSPLLVSLPLVLIDLFPNGMGYRKHEFCTKTKIRAQALRKVLWRVVWIIDIPFKLVSEYDIPNPDIELDYLNELTLHLFVLPELVDLLSHTRHDLTLEDGRQVVLLHQNLGKAIQAQIWLVLVPHEQISKSCAFNFQVEFDRDQLQIRLARILAN